MERVIGRITPGEYKFTDMLDGDGLGTQNISISCTATVEENRICFDFSESDPQCIGSLNAVRAITVSAVNYVMRCIAPSDIPTNSGIMRNVDVITKPGTIVDALPPSAVAAGNVETSQRITDVVFGVLAEALPEVIPAASQGTMNNITIGGTDPWTGVPFTYYETIGGGCGAGPKQAGESAVHSHMTNTLNTPAEALEHAYPFVVEEYSIRDDTGDNGLHCGGNGLVRRIRMVCDAEVTLLTERRTHQPWGAAGGEPGSSGANRLIRRDGSTEDLPGKCSLKLQAGDAIEIATPGGGGWGQ